MVDFAREKPLTPDDAAALFKVNRRTINNWFKRGLEKQPICGRVYTSLEAITRFSARFSQVEPPDISGQSHKESDAALERIHARWGKSARV